MPTELERRDYRLEAEGSMDGTKGFVHTFVQLVCLPGGVVKELFGAVFMNRDKVELIETTEHRSRGRALKWMLIALGFILTLLWFIGVL